MTRKKVAKKSTSKKAAKSRAAAKKKQVAKKSAPAFQGRRAASALDFPALESAVTGPHEVLYPRSAEDVRAAVALSKDRRTFVRSGLQVTDDDAVRDAGGVVIDLTELTAISREGTRVTVEAGASSQEVARFLAEHELALPLPDEPLKSAAASVVRERPSCLMRSLGSLSERVVGVHAVGTDGQAVTLSGRGALDRWRASGAVITRLVFEAAPAGDLRLRRATCPYPGEARFLELARTLFLGAGVPERADLALDAYNGPHKIPLVRVTAIATSAADEAALAALEERALAGLPDVVRETRAGAGALELLEGTGLGAALDPAIATARLQGLEPAGDREAFLVQHADDVHRGIAFGASGEGKLNRNLDLFARLQVNRDGRLEVTGYSYTPRPVEDSAAVALRAPAPLRTAAPAVGPAALRPEAALLWPRPGPIPGFRGDVYQRDDWDYAWHARQYATSSYPAERTSPFMVAYPVDVADVAAAIGFARAKGKRVVARSGGHQYSGTSSGGADTIVLSMDAFNHLRVSGNIVDVGPAVPLTALAERFKREGITIPHGECPKVCIGGHAQTGGYGHLLRGFGLALDYVRSFDIVLADGSLRTARRPLDGGPPATPDEELFWGVLGGNAGSFGIITGYTFECIRDAAHPRSYGYAATRKYTRERFADLMREVQKWTRGVVDGTLQPGLDFMMTVESAGRSPLPVLLVELVHSNPGGVNERVDGDAVFHPVIRAAEDGASAWELLLTERGPKPLSALSDSFVRRWPATTLDGREFGYPYKKRINSTTRALSDPFVAAFVDLIDRVVSEHDGVKLVFQMLIGGGAYRTSPRRRSTSIPHRDYVYCFVFDLFYARGHEAEAEQLQRDMQAVVDAHFSPDREARAFWGTFGADIDMSDPAVRDRYYDDLATYRRLQALKQRVDPTDVFHTPLTVRLPS